MAIARRSTSGTRKQRRGKSLLRILSKSFKEIDAGKGISLAEMRKRVGA